MSARDFLFFYNFFTCQANRAPHGRGSVM